ncbi:MAG: DUF58 domain-containing protein [Elusimicrobia bacterium CG06_land_8_20_14_3_00_38_11]|nr:MAG: DUF58 domain-containing protein [Elusimicrobia bacterium CG06_land_8_20_14_3_00_38_11]
MLAADLIKKIRKIEIKTGKMVNEVFAGEYKSVFKGRGMEFSEVREYQSGDDIKTIDWNVSARYGNLFVKKFIEERELTIILLIDISKSQKFGCQKSKIELVAELSGIIGFSALKNNDRIGVILFSDKIEKFIPPKKGKKHCLRIISEVLSAQAEYGTDIYNSLDYLNRVIKKRAVVFLISDFLDSGYEKLLKITSKKHDLILVNVGDPMEYKIPDFGIFHFVDAETSKDIYVDARKYIFTKNFQDAKKGDFEYLENTAKNMGIDKLNLYTDKPYILSLILFFKAREKKFR